MSCDPLKHRFLNFTQVRFWVGQEEGNEFGGPGDHLKHRFLDRTKIEFWAFQEDENDLSAIRTPESRLYQIEKVTFSVGQDADNDFKVTSTI